MKPHPIISMVRSICKSYGVRFVLARGIGSYMGQFCAEDKTLTVWTRYMRPRGRRQGKTRVCATSQVGILSTAIHEMTHMCQWRRRDPDWFARTDDGRRLDMMIFDYLSGEVGDHPRELLIRSAMGQARMELEAEITSLRIMDLFGVAYPRARTTRNAKAYAYSFVVFARTGIMADKRMWSRWLPHITNTWKFDLTNDVLDRLCEIARANSKLSFVVWDGNTCVKSTW